MHRNKPAFYSITSLARSGNPGAMFNPITLAALRLITNKLGPAAHAPRTAKQPPRRRPMS
jgi:hypothetical protein